jgi:hypothetical protein
MAKFYSTGTKKLTPLAGRTYATTYHQLTDAERQRMFDHINGIMIELLEHALETGDNDILADLQAPMKGFPRTKKQPNYSAWDVMTDLRNYLAEGKDPTEGMLGRWSRLFEEFAEVDIQVQEGMRPRVENTYGNLFQLKRG